METLAASPQHFHLTDLRNDYKSLCEHVRAHGRTVEVRGDVTREITGVTLELDLTTCTLPIGINRKINVKLAAIEALCLIGGTWRHDLVVTAAPNYARVLVNADDTYYSAYGPRVARQLRLVTRQLIDDPTTRQAVLSIWNERDLEHRGDRPCTLTQQFLLRDDALECHTYMRSQDVWLGLGIDLFVFTQLQLTLSHALDVMPGRYVHHVGSMHAYERDSDRIDQLEWASRPGPELPPGVRFPVNLRESDRGWKNTYALTAQLLLDGGAGLADETLELNPWWVARMS